MATLERLGTMINMRCGRYILAAVGFLIPAAAAGQETSRCFEVVAVGGQSALLSRMETDTLVLTKAPYSRGTRGVVWWQAFLESAAPQTSGKDEAIPWRPIGGDSVEIQLPVLHGPSQLIVQDSGSALRGYVRVTSDELGAPDARYDFLAEEIACEEVVGRSRGQSRERNPVAVILSPELPGNSAYLVERRLEHTPYDVIHLRPGADEAVLTEAIWVLLAAWDRDGVDPTTASTFTPESQEGGSFTKLPWVPRVVEDLNSAQVVGIDGVGYVHAKIIFLPRDPRYRRP